MAIADIQTSLNAGELSPGLYARVDLDKFQTGAALLRNFYVDYRGGVSNRPGTKFIAAVEPNSRLIPFIVSTAAAYVLVFSDHLITIFTAGQLVTTVATPYLAADLFAISYTQSADVLTLVHPSYPPANLSRTSDTTFVYAALITAPVTKPPTVTTMVAPHSGPYSFGYLVTAVDLDGKEESLPSNPAVKHSEAMNETTNRVVGLSWTAPLDGSSNPQPVSRYNVYKWGPIDAVTLNPATVWGFIGSSQTTTFTDNNIAADFSKQPPGWGDPFSGGQFQSIIVNAPGSGYDGVSGDWPVIPYVPLNITGDGTGAAGYAVIDHALGTIIGVYMTNPGKNYTTATITANGEGGTGATFTYTFTDPAPLNPAATAYLQQRRVFGGANLKPETIVMSQTGLYNNFNTTPVSLATDAIVMSIAGAQVNTIKHLVPVSYGMLTFTTGGSLLVSGGTPGAVISPATVSFQAQASEGANDLRPLTINYDVLYGQAKGNRIRNLAFAWQRQSYTGSDISTLAAHLFDTFHTVDWAWAEEPFKLVWAVRDDGRMLSLTYVPDQEVYAWCRHDTQGEFKSVCSIPEGATDAVYVIVKRSIPQLDVSCCDAWEWRLERLMERQACCIYDSWFLDCATEHLKLPGFGAICLDGVNVVDQVASIHVCSPSAMLRTKSISWNDASGNGNLLLSNGTVDITIPADYDSGGTEAILFTVTGGMVADGTAPTSADASIELGIYMVNGGSIRTATLSSDGFSFIPGSVVQTFGLGGVSPSYTAFGAGQVSSPYAIGGVNGNQRGATLVDGTSQGFPGDGFKHNVSDFHPWVGPIGWSPDASTVGNEIPPNTNFLQPGAVVSLYMEMFVESNDTVNPDRKVFGIIESITMSYNGTTVNIPLQTTKVGFGAGGSYTAVPSGTYGNVIVNPARTVSATIPSLTASEQDFYYTASALGVGDVVHTGCAQLAVTAAPGGNNYTVSWVGDFSEFLLPDDSNGAYRLVEAREWSHNTPVSSITATQLTGKTAWALADGKVVGPLADTGGGVFALPFAASSVVLGLRYTSQIKTLYLTTQGVFAGSDQGKRKKLSGVTLRVDCTRGLLTGDSFDYLSPVPDFIGTGTDLLFTGDGRTLTYPNWDTKGEVCIQQGDPLPATVLGIIVEVTPGDTGH